MKYTDGCIPTGYQIHVDSYENDGDNNQINIISGLSEADMRFYVDLARTFRYENGNTFHKDGDFVTLIADVVSRHPEMDELLKEKFVADIKLEVGENADDIRNEVNELLGQPDDFYHERESVFVRCARTIKVYHIKTPIPQVDISEIK